MPHFDIVKNCEPSNSFRVSKIQADFDLKANHAQEHFVGDLIIPEKWNIGVIVGGVWHREIHHCARTVPERVHYGL